MKTCTKCNKNKDESLFYFEKKLNKYISACKDCTKISKAKRYEKNRERYLESSRLYKQSSIGRYHRLKEDSLKRKIMLNITETEFLQLIDEPCYYCDNKLGAKTIYGVGLDRIDSFKGYEKDNVLPCCHFCNTLKNYLLTKEEMKKVANLLIELREGKPPVSSINIKSDIISIRN